jgi:phospholipase/carboxylesterase
MRTLKLADLNVRVTGGTDREGGGDGPLVVLLHGFGAPGDDLVPLWRQLDVPRDTRFAFPEAPLELAGLGYGDARAWWMIDVMALERAVRDGTLRDRSKEVPEGMEDARVQVEAMLGELEHELGAAPQRLILGGFSQGAMLSCDLALRSDRPLSGLVLLSGTLLAEDQWTALAPRRRGLEVLQSHGRDDPLLSFAQAERLRDLLREAGLTVRFQPFNGGHGIAPSALDALGKFVTERAQISRA